MNVGELFLKIGFKGDVKELDSFVSDLEKIPAKAMLMVFSVNAISNALQNLTSQMLETITSFQMFQSQSGLGVKQLDEWQTAAKLANVSTTEVTQSVLGLQKSLIDIQLGKGNLRPFIMMGVNPRNDPFETLRQLRQRVKSMPAPLAMDLMSQMGITPGMIQVLKLTDDQFKKFSNTIVRFGQKDLDALLKLKLFFSGSAEFISRRFLLGLATFSDFLSKTSVAATTAKLALAALFTGLTIWGAATNPFVLIGVSITALLLLLEDLASYMRGDDSLTGRAIAGIKKFFNIFEDFKMDENAPFLKNFDTLLSKMAKLQQFSSLIPAGALMPLLNYGTKAAGKLIENLTVNISTNSDDKKGVAEAVVDGIKNAVTGYQFNNNGPS